jgi:hypothetical protein
MSREVRKYGLSDRGRVSVNTKPKGKFMIAKMLKRPVASDATMDRLSYWTFGILAILILVVGERKICELSPTLTEAQLYLAGGVLLVSVFQCLIISILFDKKRKAA